MARRIGVHLMSLFSGQAGSSLKQACPEPDCLIVGTLWIFDVKV